MISKRKCLAGCKLYLILDAQVCDYGRLWDVLREAVRGGVDIVQLRDKAGPAKEVLAFATRVQKLLADRVPFIVNDRVDIALMSGAAGVHLGQDDIPIAEARKILGSRRIIGKSCQTLKHVYAAEHDDADYIGFGSVFKTLTKPGRQPMDLKILSKVATKTLVPVFAIGGITRENFSLLRACGVNRIAVCRDILLADNVRFSVEDLKRTLRVT